MLRILCGIAVAMLVFIAACSGPLNAPQYADRHCSTVDATAAWNSVCAQYGFPQAPVGNSGWSFAQAYASVWFHSGTFEDNLAACQAAVAGLLHKPDPGYTGNDLYNAGIANWPD